MYVMTLARDGPASVSSTKKTTSATAVHAVPSTTTEPHALNGTPPPGGESTASGSSATVDTDSAPVTGSIGGRSGSVLLASIGPAA